MHSPSQNGVLKDHSWRYRFLNPYDMDEVKELCAVWFPVRLVEIRGSFKCVNHFRSCNIHTILARANAGKLHPLCSQ